jgi:CheY-like chemotaxis protein/anti-sigma regulatory factor (Ser/Thr protein kinase)
LTRQLLTFSKGGAPLRKTVSVAELLKESAGFALRGSRSRCEFSVPDDLWPADVDAGQISQVIQNLIINADQATPDGGTIRVGAENVPQGAQSPPSLPEGRYIRVTIEDRGIGIPKEHLHKVFDPYFTTKQKGSGLGLSIAYSIIQRHDGHLALESELGAGTRVTFHLPASSKAVPTEPGPGGPLPRGKGKILVMDDEEMIRDLIAAMLAQLGYESACAADGVKALDLYRKAKYAGDPFDAVIMDLTVPGGMGGRQAIGKLLEFDPEARAIVSSGYSDDPIMSDFRQYGFVGVIAKPYKIEDMGAVLHKVVARPPRESSS